MFYMILAHTHTHNHSNSSPWNKMSENLTSFCIFRSSLGLWSLQKCTWREWQWNYSSKGRRRRIRRWIIWCFRESDLPLGFIRFVRNFNFSGLFFAKKRFWLWKMYVCAVCWRIWCWNNACIRGASRSCCCSEQKWRLKM